MKADLFKRSACLAAMAWGAASGRALGGVNFGQLDDFQSGTAGWQQGANSPRQPTVVSTGGPAGAGDAYLQNVSSGSFGPGGKQVMFNTSQWSEDYVSAGVTRITAELANFGATPLNMRLWVSGGTKGGQYGSKIGFPLPADGQWHAVTFDLSAAGMSPVVNTDTLASVMSKVTELRILSAGAPTEHGDLVAATLGADDIRATTVPGDTNHDNSVNFSDLLALAQHYGATGASWDQGDVNFDGTVNFNDLLALAQNYGSSVSFAAAATGQVSPAPEPGGWAFVAALSLMCRTRRRRAGA